MNRAFLLVLSVALAALVFAPVAGAQSDDMGMENRGMHRGADDSMMATPTASASMMSTASASSMSSASSTATATASATSSGKSKAAPKGHLPRTGGVPLAPLLAVGALSLLMGTGLLAAGLVRRSS